MSASAACDVRRAVMISNDRALSTLEGVYKYQSSTKPEQLREQLKRYVEGSRHLRGAVCPRFQSSPVHVSWHKLN